MLSTLEDSTGITATDVLAIAVGRGS